VDFDDPQFNMAQTSDLQFLPLVPRVFEITLTPSRVCEIECTTVTLCWGKEPSQVQFKWDLYVLARRKEQATEAGTLPHASGKHTSLT